MLSVSLFTWFIVPPVKDQIRLAREENMEYVGRIASRTPFVDDVIVFVIFLAVCSPPQQSPSFLNGWYRTGTCRWDISSGRCIVSRIEIYPRHTVLTCSNPRTVDYSPKVSQRVSDIVN